MTKSILKHKIQTLTGRNIKQLEEMMGYKVTVRLLDCHDGMCFTAKRSQRAQYGH